MINPRDAEDIAWALNESEGELGLTSNFRAVAHQIELGVVVSGGVLATSLSDRAVEAAGRERVVRRALARMSGKDVRTLVCMYGRERGPNLVWGRLTPLAFETKLGRKIGPERVVRASWRVKCGGSTPQEVSEVHAMRREAEEMHERAMSEYAKAKQRRRVE